METGRTEHHPSDALPADEQSHLLPGTRYWVAALVQMNTEKKVGALLGKLGYDHYIPTQTEIRQWSDRKKKIEKVVIPMIVFISVNPEEVKRLRTLSSIHRFISYPGEREPAVIPNEQIEKLKFMLHHADSAVEFSETVYEIGEEIEIVRGPLKGLYGELCYVEKGNPKLGVYVELLGYSYVNVDMKDVKARR